MYPQNVYTSDDLYQWKWHVSSLGNILSFSQPLFIIEIDLTMQLLQSWIFFKNRIFLWLVKYDNRNTLHQFKKA